MKKKVFSSIVSAALAVSLGAWLTSSGWLQLSGIGVLTIAAVWAFQVAGRGSQQLPVGGSISSRQIIRALRAR